MLKIDCDFPGGNILVERIEDDTLYLSPDMRDTAGSWFYWAFRLRGAAGRRLDIRFTAHNPVGMRGPALSCDGGLNWQWSREPFTTDSFTLTVPQGQDDLLIYGQPPGSHDLHCRHCGSFLYSYIAENGNGHVAMGTLVDAPSIRPQFHMFVGSKAPWHEITDGLPQYEGFPG